MNTFESKPVDAGKRSSGDQVRSVTSILTVKFTSFGSRNAVHTIPMAKQLFEKLPSLNIHLIRAPHFAGTGSGNELVALLGKGNATNESKSHIMIISPSLPLASLLPE